MAIAEGDYATYWRERAACLRMDPDLFFPVGNSGLMLQQIEEAKAVCGRCAVVEQCLACAMELRQVDGIWGGTTASERRAMYRRAGRREKNTVTSAA
ncbi:WhiB family transcriptional regulator [Streptomyces sp. NPDC005708]|uniref:WhiB family transcriptional regulator n=1 Tax=Streptomyces sp. NPDC005708 TaxID=3154564 RepID=UPI0033F6F81B